LVVSGPSGALGKTTLLRRCKTRLEVHEAGTVIYRGQR